MRIGGPLGTFVFSLFFSTILSHSSILLSLNLLFLFCFKEEFLGLKQAEVFVRTGPDPSAALPGSDIKTTITQERHQSWHFHSIFNKNSPAAFQPQLFMRYYRRSDCSCTFEWSCRFKFCRWRGLSAPQSSKNEISHLFLITVDSCYRKRLKRSSLKPESPSANSRQPVGQQGALIIIIHHRGRTPPWCSTITQTFVWKSHWRHINMLIHML